MLPIIKKTSEVKMNYKKKISAGQKRRTPLLPSLHTSYFFKQEAKHVISKNENRFRMGAVTLIICAVPTLVLSVCFCTICFFKQYPFSTLTPSAGKLLLCTFLFCVTLSGSFICYALFSGSLLFAYGEEKDKSTLSAVLYAFCTKRTLGKVFGEYLIYLILNSIISVFPIFCVTFNAANEKNDITSIIIYTVFILTYLYLLCIINGVFVIMSCMSENRRFVRAVSLFKGHICEFIFLNIRLIPSFALSVLSLGVLHVTHTSPLVYASYACFASYAEDVGKYGKILPKGTYTNEQ